MLNPILKSFDNKLKAYVELNKKSNSKYHIKKLEKEFIKTLSNDDIKLWKKGLNIK